VSRECTVRNLFTCHLVREHFHTAELVVTQMTDAVGSSFGLQTVVAFDCNQYCFNLMMVIGGLWWLSSCRHQEHLCIHDNAPMQICCLQISLTRAISGAGYPTASCVKLLLSLMYMC